MRVNIENAILSSFFFANDLGDDLSHIYKLDESIFTSSFRKRVAVRLNAVKDGFYGFESHLIQDSVEGTKFEEDFLDILAQTTMPLSVSKKYHDKLVADDRIEKML